jgi:hypothetical protein
VEHYQREKRRQAGEVSLPIALHPFLETDDSGKVLTLPPNRTVKAGRNGFGGNCRPLSPGNPKLFGTTYPANHSRRASTKKPLE